jgi:hypothetical protein
VLVVRLKQHPAASNQGRNSYRVAWRLARPTSGAIANPPIKQQRLEHHPNPLLVVRLKQHLAASNRGSDSCRVAWRLVRPADGATANPQQTQQTRERRVFLCWLFVRSSSRRP